MSLTPEQRARILYLSHVDGASIVIIAAMTGLSRSTVRRVLQEAPRQDEPVMGKAAMRPSSKGHIERPNHQFHARLLRFIRDAQPPSPPRRHSRREGTS